MNSELVSPEQPSSHLMLTEGTYQCLVIVFDAPLLLSHAVLGRSLVQ